MPTPRTRLARRVFPRSTREGSAFPAGALDWEEYLGSLEEIGYRGFLTVWPSRPAAVPLARLKLHTPVSDAARNSSSMTQADALVCRLRINRRSRQRRVDHDVGGDLGRARVCVTLAVEAGVPFEGAADVELRVDDRPVVVELDPFELGKTAASARGLGVLDVFEIEPDLGRQQIVVVGDGDQRMVRKELGDELAKRRIEGRTAARGIGEQRSAARVEVLRAAPGGRRRRAARPTGRGCRRAGNRSGSDRARTGLSG